MAPRLTPLAGAFSYGCPMENGGDLGEKHCLWLSECPLPHILDGTAEPSTLYFSPWALFC